MDREIEIGRQSKREEASVLEISLLPFAFEKARGGLLFQNAFHMCDLRYATLCWSRSNTKYQKHHRTHKYQKHHRTHSTKNITERTGENKRGLRISAETKRERQNTKRCDATNQDDDRLDLRDPPLAILSTATDEQTNPVATGDMRDDEYEYHRWPQLTYYSPNCSERRCPCFPAKKH